MAKVVQAYADNRGKRHDTPTDATISDLAAVLGRISLDAGIAGGIAKLILEKRAEIEQVFAQHDAMNQAPVLPDPKDKAAALPILVEVRAGFMRQGTSFKAWCQQRGVDRGYAHHVISGHTNGPRARILRAEILAAARAGGPVLLGPEGA